MPWLVRGDEVLASLEQANGRRARRRGLIGRSELSGALHIEPARAVHTIGVKFPIDVAFLDGDGVVIDMVTMKPYRLGRPRLASRSVIEAQAGAFGRWVLRTGDRLEVKA